MNKRILSLITLSIMCVGMMPNCLAAYPSSAVTVDFGEQLVVSGTKSWTESPKENKFIVDGKEFILLDTDSEGNYFVLTEDHYGGYPIDSGKVSSVVVQTAVTKDGVTTYTDGTENLAQMTNGLFDSQREGSIGYWLNNGFFTDGNTEQYKLPDKIKENIIEKEWEIEGFETVRGWTSVSYYDTPLGVTKAQDFAQSFKAQPYNVTAKVALLSYTEYMTYKDKIGVMFSNSAGWAGMPLRTTDAMMVASNSGDTRTLMVKRAPLMLKTKNADQTDNSELVISYADGFSTKEYYTRPCFFLDKDFFKNVACDIFYDENGTLSVGSNVLAKIKQHSADELKVIYSDAFLNSLGLEIADLKYDIYPTHPEEVADLKVGETGKTGISAYYESPKENLFTVDGKSFILLDIDENENFFIMANEEYGQRLFTTNSVNKDSKESDWYFDPEAQSSIAYWLNNDFLTDGNVFKGENEKHKIPDSIQKSLIEHEWDIEPHYPINGWKVNFNADENTKTEIEAWRTEQIAQAKPRTVKCKVALPSYTEYNAYKEKIGMTVLAGGYAGFSLRTPRSQVDAESNGTWSATIGQLQVAISGNNLVYSTCGANNDIYYVRPVMWIDKKFFTGNKLDLLTVGDNVKTVMASVFDYYDLKNIYSDEEILSIGIKKESDTTEAVPKAENVIISGVANVGTEVVGSYKFISGEIENAAAGERNSVFSWYISDTETGAKTKIANTKEITIDESYSGKYITFGVTPKNAWGILGTECLSRPKKVEACDILIKKAEFSGNGGNAIYSANGHSEISVNLSFSAQSEGLAYLALYDADGKLEKMQSAKILTEDTEIEITLSDVKPGGGAKVKLIVFGDDLTIPVYTKVI